MTIDDQFQIWLKHNSKVPADKKEGPTLVEYAALSAADQKQAKIDWLDIRKSGIEGLNTKIQASGKPQEEKTEAQSAVTAELSKIQTEKNKLSGIGVSK